MLRSVCCGGWTQTLPCSHSRALTAVPYRQPEQPLRGQVGLQQPITLFVRWPACVRPCGAPAAVTQAASTAADAELPSAAEQVAMDEVAAELVAKLNAAYVQMEPDDVDSGAYPFDKADATEVEPAAASTGRAARQGGRKRKPQPKEIPADALPKVRC